MAAAPYAAPQQVYFGHPAPGQFPPQAAVFGFPQHLVPGMGPGAPVMMPHNMQRLMHPGQRIGARHGAMSPQMYRQQHQVAFLSVHVTHSLVCTNAFYLILTTCHGTLHQTMSGISHCFLC